MKGKISVALDEAFELVEKGDTGFAGQFIIDGKWYFPKFGCDSLQKFIDTLRETSNETNLKEKTK